jgi:hypothetical protein
MNATEFCLVNDWHPRILPRKCGSMEREEQLNDTNSGRMMNSREWEKHQSWKLSHVAKSICGRDVERNNQLSLTRETVIWIGGRMWIVWHRIGLRDRGIVDWRGGGLIWIWRRWYYFDGTNLNWCDVNRGNRKWWRRLRHSERKTITRRPKSKYVSRSLRFEFRRKVAMGETCAITHQGQQKDRQQSLQASPGSLKKRRRLLRSWNASVNKMIAMKSNSPIDLEK